MKKNNPTGTISDAVFDEERALYGADGLTLINVSFDGEADGESALKESKNIIARNCYCNLRYPFWHVAGLTIEGSTMTENCRAALWYCNDVTVIHTRLGGIKAVRECDGVKLFNCDIDSEEFGWFSKNISLMDCKIISQYLFLKSSGIKLKEVDFKGKYSFQYVSDLLIEDCFLDTKDAFWHSKNVTVRNSTVKGEYLGWYSENLTFENCKIIGTQPLCYCKNLKLINCEMENTDLCFERSYVEASIIGYIESIKNVYGGYVEADEIGEIICDDDCFEGQILIRSEKD